MPPLTPVSYLVLGMLEQAGEATPYELKQMAASVSGLWTLRHDQVYRETERLAPRDWRRSTAKSTAAAGGASVCTEAGRMPLMSGVTSPTAEFTELRDTGLLQFCPRRGPRPAGPAQLEAHEQQAWPSTSSWPSTRASRGAGRCAPELARCRHRPRARMGPLLVSPPRGRRRLVTPRDAPRVESARARRARQPVDRAAER